MSTSHPDVTLDTVPLTVARQIDAVCRRFEDAWRQGTRPDIGAFADTAPVGGRPDLLLSLIRLDAFYRRRAGDTPSAADYLGRFPDLDPAAVAAATEGADVEAGPPPVAGYQLLDEIGRGGMGVVYRARDVALNRDVAVKLLSDRAAGGWAATCRFLEEAQITGQLQHPGIPPVHQTGTTPDGRPFLAMKLIRGETLDALLKARVDRWEGGRLLGVFEQVCQAVGYAHSRGVIHRDLKPANVMVGAFGEVQVMDWGLAKVLASGGRPPPDTNPDAAGPAEHQGANAPRPPDVTLPGSILGTPAYMSPEQAAGSIDQVDKRSDVFGLGGVLCALLTGAPPFVGNTMLSTQQLAAEGRLDGAYTRLDACGAEPDLVALCKRCLAAGKADRPADGGEVAAVVSALRGAAEERAREAERSRARAEVRAAEERRRRRAGWVFAGLVLGILLAGGGLSGWQWWRAERALDEKGQKVADLTASRQRNVDALRTLTDQFVGERITRREALTDRDRQFFRDVKRLWEEVAAASGETEEARALRAEAAYRVAFLQADLSEHAGAEAGYRRAIDLLRALAADFPGTPSYRDQLARTHGNLGRLLATVGRPDDAERALRDALAVARPLADEFRDNPDYGDGLAGVYANLGLLYASTGRPDDAEREYRNALAVWQPLADGFPDHFGYRDRLATTHVNVGNLLFATTGKPDDAQKAYSAARDEFRRLVDKSPGNPEYRYGLADAHNNLANLHAQARRLPDAERDLVAARDAYRSLVTTYPGDPRYRDRLAGTLTNLGALFRMTDRRAEAERAYQDAVDLRRRLVADYPDPPGYRVGLANTLTNLGNLFQVTNRPADAKLAYQEALPIRLKLATDEPSVPDYQYGAATTMMNLAILANSRKDYAEARRLLGEAVPYHRAALKPNHGHPQYRQSFRTNRSALAVALLGLGEHAAVPGCAAELVEYATRPAGDAYDAACFLARCVPLAERDGLLYGPVRYLLARRYADLAMVFLTRAVRLGWTDAAHTAKDPDLTPLRGRTDFRWLLAKMEAGRPPAAR